MRFSVLGLIRLAALLSIGSVGLFADIVDYTWTGPDKPNPNPGPSGFVGTPCNPASDSACVLGQNSGSTTGDPYTIKSVTLAELSSSGGTATWKLTIQEETPYNGLPDAANNPTAFGDFLIQWNNPAFSGPSYYGIALGGTCTNDAQFTAAHANTTCGSYVAHDSLTAGALYQDPTQGNSGAKDSYPNMYQTAGAVSGTGRVLEPVWVGSDMTTVAGSPASNGFSVTRNSSVTGTGQTDYSLYTIMDTFTTSSNFLASGTFLIDLSSYVCANFLILGAPAASGVPEPRMLFLLIPALLLFVRFARSRKVTA